MSIFDVFINLFAPAPRPVSEQPPVALEAQPITLGKPQDVRNAARLARLYEVPSTPEIRDQIADLCSLLHDAGYEAPNNLFMARGLAQALDKATRGE